MKHLVSIVLSVLLLTTISVVEMALAEEDSASVLSMNAEPRTQSSAENRLDKGFTAVFSPVGIGPSAQVEAGVAVGRFLTPSTLAQLELGFGETSRRNEFLTNSSQNLKTGSVSVNLKHFVGNSFYIKGGLDHRTVSYDYKYGNTFAGLGDANSPHSSYDFTGNSWSGSFSIGNQWQWEKFTLGCDWFGLTVPFASNVQNESLSSRGSSSFVREIRQDRENEENRLLKDVAFQAVRFYLGASF